MVWQVSGLLLALFASFYEVVGMTITAKACFLAAFPLNAAHHEATGV